MILLLYLVMVLKVVVKLLTYVIMVLMSLSVNVKVARLTNKLLKKVGYLVRTYSLS